MNSREWDPNEWESHCSQLLTIHYGPRVQIYPARGQGDGGLEAYVADESTAFQCYAPEDPFSLSAQTDAQKEKVRADTKKLLDHPDRTQELIGVGAVIETWVLLTPRFEDKSLVEYANKQAARISSQAIEKSHTWCSPNLRISIHDDSLFSLARAQLLGIGSTQLRPAMASVDVSLLREEGSVEASFDDILEGKLSADPKLAGNPGLLRDYKDETLSDYFVGKSEISRLSRDSVAAHEAVQSCANMVFAGLARAIAESDERPVIVVKGITAQLSEMVGKRLVGFSSELCLLLARYFIASWWLDCPLRFEVDDA